MTSRMKAIICAAGVGRRLLPLTANHPKSLITVGQKTILEYQLDALSESNLSQVVIVVGHGAEAVRKKIGTRYQNCSISYIYNRQYATTNNIYSLWLARKQVSDGMLFLNGDVIFNASTVKRLLSEESPESVATDYSRELADDALRVRFEGGRLVEIGKSIRGAADGWAIGLYKLSPTTSAEYFRIAGQLFAADAKNRNISFVVPIQKMAGKVLIKGTAIDGCPWVEIDTHEDYKNAQNIIHTIVPQPV